MNAMFYNCSSLKSINFSNFDTSLVNSMAWMFLYCNSLESIDLSNFNTSSVTDMGAMFRECTSLKSINLSNFNTSSVTMMRAMFDNCNSLKSINLSNFDTSSLTSMNWMFSRCSSLEFLNLSNFNTSLITDMGNICKGCSSLKSIYLSNFDTSLVTDMTAMFYDCNSLNYLDISNFNTSLVTNMSLMFFNCSSLKSINLSNFDTSLVTDMRYMFSGCNSLNYLDISNFNMINCNEYRDMFTNDYDIRYINIFNVKIDKILSNYFSIYVDQLDELYVCQANEILKNLNIYNCCDFNFETNECNQFPPNKIDTCSGINFIQGLCNNTNKTVDKNNYTISYFINDILDDIEKGKFNDIFNEIIAENKSTIKSENNATYIISTVSSQYSTNYSTVDLRDCESKLKESYSLDKNESLILLKVEYNIIKQFKIPITEYQLFTKNGTKLYLNICDTIPEIISIPVNINEDEEFIHNPKSDFYQDKCSTYTSEYNTDLSMYDRKNNYNKKYLALCEKKCEYLGYNSESKKVDCKCQTKTKFPKLPIDDVNINDFLNQFVDVIKHSNFFYLLVIKKLSLLMV